MKYTKKQLNNLIRNTVSKVTGINIESDEVSLLDTRYQINPVDFLYIFEVLEKELGISPADILKKNDYTVMKINNMSEALLGLLNI